MPNESPGVGPSIPFEASELKLSAGVDPNLQRLAAKAASDAAAETAIMPRNAPSAFPEEGETVEVDLIGKLRDPDVEVPGLMVVRALGDLFTGTAKAGDLEAILQHENVVSIELAKPVMPMLSVSVPEIQATPDQIHAALPAGATVPDGSGVVVGVIDNGCDFVHPNFRNSDGSTRIRFLWDQSGGFNSVLSPDGFFYGREFDASRINAALTTPDPYTTMGYDPGLEAHGTHVLDIAAGSGQATGNPGVAPNADIIFVDLKGGGGGQDTSFGNSRSLMEAAEYIFAKAAELGKKAVVNISQGTHGGPHDGSTPAEQWFDQLLQVPDRAMVLAAGNAWRHMGHTSGVVRAGEPTLFGWVIQPGDPTNNELEVWYEADHRLEIILIDPGGRQLPGIPLGHSQVFLLGGHETVSIIHNERVGGDGDNQISILLDRALSTGAVTPQRWVVALRAIGEEDVPFHAWIERDDHQVGTQSFLDQRAVSTSHTLSSIACGNRTIAVGSYMAGDPDLQISPFSSEGPTRDGKHKPEVSGPGQHVSAPSDLRGIEAAASRRPGTVRKAGTSMSAPHVTGLIALLMQVAPGNLTNDDIRQAVIDAARRNPPEGVARTWDARYGFGRVDAAAVLLAQHAP